MSKGGAEEADILISVLENDEMNMVTCQISKHIFKIPSTISKIKESNYLDKKWSKLFSDKCLSVDHIISPEIEIANEMQNDAKNQRNKTIFNEALSNV